MDSRRVRSRECDENVVPASHCSMNEHPSQRGCSQRMDDEEVVVRDQEIGAKQHDAVAP